MAFNYSANKIANLLPTTGQSGTYLDNLKAKVEQLRGSVPDQVFFSVPQQDISANSFPNPRKSDKDLLNFYTDSMNYRAVNKTLKEAENINEARGLFTNNKSWKRAKEYEIPGISEDGLNELAMSDIYKIPYLEEALKRQNTLETDMASSGKVPELVRGIKLSRKQQLEDHLNSINRAERQEAFTSTTAKPEVSKYFAKRNALSQYNTDLTEDEISQELYYKFTPDSYHLAHNALNPGEAEYIFPPGTYFHNLDSYVNNDGARITSVRAVENPNAAIERLKEEGVDPDWLDRLKIKRYAMGAYPNTTALSEIQPPEILRKTSADIDLESFL